MSPSADRLRTVERGIKGMGLALASLLHVIGWIGHLFSPLVVAIVVF